MSTQLRAMPAGVRLFLLYGLLLLAILGLLLPLIVEQAATMPISAVGVVWMLLLAYAVFTLTLVWQRKQAAWRLALGLATLTLPLVPLLAMAAGLLGAAVALGMAALLFGGLLQPATRAWFTEP
ncbi:MAG TPA: hypothetical protein VFK38_02230 [Candidatus Limnocylindrales bacterium]|nr:hypothetical protein [Candidatus Limnocylindrales bacterium]